MDIEFQKRNFIVGPNASGKSNLLDSIRFLHEIAVDTGTLRGAIEKRGDIKKIRYLPSRKNSDVEIGVHLGDLNSNEIKWKYELGLNAKKGIPIIKYERVYKGNILIVNRPNESDDNDEELLFETYLEYRGKNQEFREFRDYLTNVKYLHLVPQLLRNPDAFGGKDIPEDPYGKKFLETIAKTPSNIRDGRLKKIERILMIAVPNLAELKLDTESNRPHLQVKYQHWRPNGGIQTEEQFSDGTLRLIGLLWSILEINDSTLLLEEPELSLHSAIVKQLPSLIYGMQKNTRKKGQYIMSTHSGELLYDRSIAADEIIVLVPGKEGTQLFSSLNINDIRKLVDAGFSPGEATFSYQVNQGAQKNLLEFFK